MLQRSYRRRSSGFALLALLVLVTLGGLYFFVNNLTPAAVAAKRQQQSSDSLNLARDALIGYALRYREDQLKDNPDTTEMYGYLPLPDMGTVRNNNVSCTDEGCDAARFTGLTFSDDVTGAGPTVIGRFPWRMLGTGPLKDGDGECLWYAVSASHSRIRKTNPIGTSPLPMNWDTLAHLDLLVANNTTELISALTSAHERPIAVVFSPGAALSSQNRAAASPATDVVTECGGNYDVKNYLDPNDAASLGTVSNFFSGATNSATGDTTALAAGLKKLSAQGVIQKDSASKLWPRSCSTNNCTTVANDTGLGLTGDTLFTALRNSSVFRLDINSMLDRMTTCLRDKIAGGSTPGLLALTGVTSPTDKNIGRIPTDSCYDDTANPKGYFSNYQNQIFVATKVANDFKVLVDGTENTCAAVLLFADQRSSSQRRTSTVVNTVQELNTPSNYLEGDNLTCLTTENSACFTSGGSPRFVGPSTFTKVSSSQTLNQDIVRCVPTTASLQAVASTNLTAAQQLVTYDAASQTLVLGKTNVTNSVAGAANLFGCVWQSDEQLLANGYRTYFQFSFATVGTNVGNTGFVFALIDDESNSAADGTFIPPCGSAGSYLGYAGNNGLTPKINFPKLGIEFDQSCNPTFSESLSTSSTNVGRNDDLIAGTCSGTTTHAAIIYWGHEQANAVDVVTLPDNDDNVHGFPTAASLTSVRRPPRNPSAAPGVKVIDLRTGGKIFHVRVEITPSRTTVAPAEESNVTMQTKVWVLADSATVANQITAMKNTTRSMAQLYPTFGETLSDTATVFDVATAISCSVDPCPNGQSCGSDHVCYRKAFSKVRMGFTNSQRTQDQQVTILNRATTWLPE